MIYFYRYTTNTNRTLTKKMISSCLRMFVPLLLYCVGFTTFTNGHYTTTISKVVNTSWNFHQQQQQQQDIQQRVLQILGRQICNLCPNDNEELIPNAEYEFLYFPYKCSDILNITAGGCLIRQEYVRTICCRIKSDNPNPPISEPGPVPVPSPTEPVPVPVPVPVDVSSTASPASVPSLTDYPIPFNDSEEFRTQEPFDIDTTKTPPPQMTFNSEASTDILIRMESAPSALNTPELISTFEFVIGSILGNSVIALLWNESFNSITKVVVNVTVTNQRSTTTTPIQQQQQQQQQSTLNRMRRIQQSQSQFFVNNVITNVDGIFTNTGDAAVVVPTDTWRKVIIQVINENERTFVEALYKSNYVYYLSLSKLSSSDDTDIDDSSTGPSSYSSISSSAIVGIVLATTIVIVLVILLYIVITKKKKNLNDTTTGTNNNNNNNDDESLKEDYFDNVDDAETLRQVSYRTRLNTSDTNNIQQQQQQQLTSTTEAEAAATEAEDQSMISTTPVTGIIPKRVQATKSEHQQHNSSKNSNNNQPTIKIKKIIPMPETIEVINEKTIIVPTGTLGLLVETNNEFGPTITEINTDSPLVGHVIVRDVIASINGINTLKMTGSAVAKLLIDTSTISNRKIIILSHSVSLFNQQQQQEQPEQYISNENQSTIDIDSNGAVCSSVQSVAVIGINSDRTNAVLNSSQQQTKVIANKNTEDNNEQAELTYNTTNGTNDIDTTIIEQVVTAPPGQLKLILEETIYGLKINGIQNDSLLLNKVSIGDTIVQVNGKQCTAMRISDISNLRFGFDINERQLVVVSRLEPTTTARGTGDDNDDNDDNDSEDGVDIDLSSNVDAYKNAVNNSEDDDSEIDLSEA